MLPRLPRPRLVEMLRAMLVIRRFEEALIKLAAETPVGHFHVYIGQEATGVAALSLMRDGDTAFTTHRNHGHLLARGADPGRMLAEILGKATGYNRGKGGTLHIASKELGFPMTSASVGGCIPIAAGSAFAFQRRKVPQVSVCLIGDGALEEGVFHESINMAALGKLPVIFLIENNSLEALGQKANEYPSSTLAAVELTSLAKPYGVPARVVDGTDCAAVYGAMRTAVQRARRGQGPSFVEARTVRWPGSRPLWPQLVTGATDVEYAWDRSRIPAPHASWFGEQDPVLCYARELVAANVASKEDVRNLDADVQRSIATAVEFAKQSPYPPVDQAYEDVFAGVSAR